MLRPELKIPEVHTINAKHVLIIGAGPAGLINALLLAQQGVKITVADSWLGKFTRAHEVIITTVHEIEKAIAPLKFSIQSPKPQVIQLKDIEKQLFKHLKTLKRKNPSNIQLIKKQFHSFSPKRKVLLVDKNASPQAEKMELTEVDMVIDCTGEQRAGLVNYNAQQTDTTVPRFIIEPLLETQTPTLFGKMRVISKKDLLIDLNIPEKTSIFGDHFSDKEKLTDLGWEETYLPQTYAMLQLKKIHP